MGYIARTALRVIKSVQFRLGRLSRSLEERVEGSEPSVAEAPILVLGNQKSGTTAIAALLAERADLSFDYDVIQEDNPLITQVYRGNRPVDEIINEYKNSFSKELFKDPHMTFMYSNIREVVRDARFLLVVRDPRSNIRSILDRLKLPGDMENIDSHTYDGSQFFTESWTKIILGSYGLEIQGENYVDKLAGRWKRAANVYLENRKDIELVRYKDFTEEKNKKIDELVVKLGEEKINSIEEKVDEQFQPRGHRRDVEWSSFFGKSNLRRIEERCAEEMRALGYSDFHSF